MKSWALKKHYPYSLVLAADARMSAVDYVNDQIWELRLGTGESIALSLHTTYGTRARDMRLFFSFQEEDREAYYARDYHQLPQIHTILPNLAEISCQPLKKLPVRQTFFVYDSQTLIGRLHLANPTTRQRTIHLRLGGILAPLAGTPLHAEKEDNVYILRGQTGNLHPTIFITGGAELANTPYVALDLPVTLGPGGSRTFTWIHLGAESPENAFDLARRIAAQPLDALMARAHRLHQAETISFETGDRDWDILLALSQTAALGKLLRGPRLPYPAPVGARQPDQGYAPQGDPRAHPEAWQGQTAFDLWYLSRALPGAPNRWRDALRNFLEIQSPDGSIDARPGLGGQRLNAQAAPLLADVALRYWQTSHDDAFLLSIYPALLRFFLSWFPEEETNTCPRWQHPLQTGYEDNPLFSCAATGQAIRIDRVLTPALSALLLHEGQALLKIAAAINEKSGTSEIHQKLSALRQALEHCWQAERHLFTYCDSDTHLVSSGQLLSQRRVRRRFQLKKKLAHPVRLQIILEKARADGQRPQVHIQGQRDGETIEETLPPEAFCWQGTRAIATSQQTWDQLGTFTLENIQATNKISIRTVDLTQRDLTLFLPLWGASLPSLQVQTTYAAHLRPGRAFGHTFGLSMQPEQTEVRPLWNALLLEGLLRHGLHQEAAEILIQLGQATIRSLTTRKAFYNAYHSRSGDGLGARHTLQGVFPVSLFLDLLGIAFPQERTVTIRGENPFPWPITVRYRAITIERDLDETRVRWLDDPPLRLPPTGTHHISF